MEPSRFCPKCGAQLPSEFVGEPLHSTPVQPQPATAAGPSATAQPRPFTVAGSSGTAHPQEPVSNPSPQVGPPKVLIGILLVVATALAVLFVLILSPSKGITGSWSMNIDMNQLMAMVGESGGGTQEEIEMVTNMMTSMGIDQMVVTVDLNEDNSMSLSTKIGEDSISGGTTVSGTYEILSDHSLRIHANEATTRMTFFGVTQNETEDMDSTVEYDYRLDGDTLTLISDDVEIEFQRD